MRKIVKKSIISLCVLIVGMTSTVYAALEDHQKDLRLIQDELAQTQPNVKKLRQKAEELSLLAQKLRQNLTKSATKLQTIELEVQNIEGQVAELTTQESQIKTQLDTQREKLIKTVSAMRRLSLAPKTPLGTTHNPQEAMQTAILLRSLTDELAQSADLLKRDLAYLNQTREKLEEEKVKLADAQKQADAERVSLSGLLDERQQQIKKNRVALNVNERKVSELMAGQKTIQGLIDQVRKQEIERQAEIKKRQEEIARLERQKRQEEANVKKQEQARLEQQKAVLRTKEDTFLSNVAFEQYRGKLSSPLVGKTVVAFGQKDSLGNAVEGIRIAGRSGSIVTTPISGKVIYAGMFRDYGYMVILKPAADYHILFSGLSKVDVIAGQWLSTHEPIGRLEDEPYTLYFEIRKNRIPVNPQAWVNT